MKRGTVFGFVLTSSAALLALLVPRSAHAFERQWHVGGGAGITAYPHYYSVGPALGLNGAYGISDVFDVKLELLGSLNSYTAPMSDVREHAAPWSAVAGLSYKLDILQWIPYGALLVGYQHVAGRLPAGDVYRRNDATAAIVLGLDYAVSRDFGLGASVRTDFLLTSKEHGEAFTPMLRAEYHWGF
jgi:hypothetical protein